MKIFKSRYFHFWAKSERIEDDLLVKSIDEIKNGLFDANLGNGLYKKRIARKGHGKRSGFRTIVAFKKNDRSFFMFGFAKNDKENISRKEELVYRNLAKYFLEMPETKINLLIMNGELFEVKR